MKKVNKLFIGLFSTLFAVSFLTGCNSGTGGSKIKLKIGFWPEKTETQDLAMYNNWKANFEKDYPQYEIVGDPYIYSTETIGQKAVTKQLPTVFQTWFTEPDKLVSKGYIRSIDKQLKDLKWNEKMDEEMKASLTFNDEIYGIPRDGYGLGLLINLSTLYDNELIDKDENGNYLLYHEDGTPAYPTTFEEIHDIAEAIAEYSDTKGILICSTNKNGGWQFSNIAWNYGAVLEEKDASGKWVSHLDSDEAINALSWIQQMKNEELLLNSVSVSYDDWYNAIESKVAMAIVGSDVLQLAKLNGNVDMDNLAFVPMPTGDGVHHYSLYGGTPYVFDKNATDEQVEGVLKFFEYIGRSPDVTDISKEAMITGNEVAKNKNQPILPKIKPWVNDEYVSYAAQLEEEYVNVNMEYYHEFFDKINENKHSEVPYGAQEMYEFLDTAIIEVLKNPSTASPKNLLTTANAKMQEYLNKNVN